jgi:parallel beta-helix repeat protein
MNRLSQVVMGGFRTSSGRWTLSGLVAAALLLALGAASHVAAADDCVALGGAINGTECQISGIVPGAKTGTFTLNETLHFLSGGTVTVGAAGIVINVTSGGFIMEDNSFLDGNVAGCNRGAAIAVTVQNGDVNLKPGSTVRSDSCSGGFIQITNFAPHKIDIDGLVESTGTASGTGANSGPGGGPITIKAGCELTVSDAGRITSFGLDPGADLVHLEGCKVSILGIVESFGKGHDKPENPANSCSDVTSNSPRRNPVTRPGKPQNSTGCVEIWSGTTLIIDSTDSHHGEVNADIGFSGGPDGRGWIDLLANGNITIVDGIGNNHTAPAFPPGFTGGPTITDTFAVHANSGGQRTDDGGLILIQSYNGDVSASGDAIQADSTEAGGRGGKIRVEAWVNVNFDAASIFARGDFDATGGFGAGGKIGPLAATAGEDTTPPFPSPIRAFTGFLSWQTGGVGDARPTGSLVTVVANRGQINLQACTTVTTTGSTFPVNGSAVGTYPNVLALACSLTPPTGPSYINFQTDFPKASCTTLCREQGGAKKRGLKFNDLNSNGVQDPGDDPIAGWKIRAYAFPGAFVDEQVTDAVGKYEFDLFPGEYIVCEVLESGWTQTLPKPPLGGEVASCDGIDPLVTLAPLGYRFTLIADQILEGNDFGNNRPPVECLEDPTATITIAVDANNVAHGVPGFPTVQEAYNAATNGDTIGIYSNTTENIELGGSKALKITQCTTAKVTAADLGNPVWKLTSTGTLVVVGPEAFGGTVGWSLVTGSHEVKSVRSTGASQYGILIGQNSNGNSVSFNSVSGSPVGVRIEGDGNDVRGGTVSGNSGDGVQLSSTASGNSFSGATVRDNGGNGILVEGSSNPGVKSNKADNNGLNGILVTGNGNTIKSNSAGSDKGKGNGLDGIMVSGTGNTLEGNKANANVGNGFTITSTATGTKLKSNESNQTADGGNKENSGYEYKLDAAGINQGGNKADTIGIPKTSAPQKCPTFPAVGTCGE